MQLSSGRTLALAGLVSTLLVGCNSPMNSNSAGSGVTATRTLTVSPSLAEAGALAGLGPLRCAPSEGMLGACSGKASGDACTLTGKRDAGWSLPGSCRSTFDGSGLACVPTPPGPPTFLVNACSGLASGGACSVTAPSGRTFQGTCTTARASGTLFCGRAHSPPAAVLDACSGKSAGDACSRPDKRGATSKPGICRLDKEGALACRRSSSPGLTACAGLDAGATCSLAFGQHQGHEAPGSCVVPASGGAASCLVSCVDLFHRHHRYGFSGWGGKPHGGPWWKHGASDAGTASP